VETHSLHPPARQLCTYSIYPPNSCPRKQHIASPGKPLSSHSVHRQMHRFGLLALFPNFTIIIRPRMHVSSMPMMLQISVHPSSRHRGVYPLSLFFYSFNRSFCLCQSTSNVLRVDGWNLPSTHHISLSFAEGLCVPSNFDSRRLLNARPSRCPVHGPVPFLCALACSLLIFELF